MTDKIVTEWRRTGLNAMLTPKELGGPQISYSDALRIVERTAHAGRLHRLVPDGRGRHGRLDGIDAAGQGRGHRVRQGRGHRRRRQRRAARRRRAKSTAAT